MIQISKKEIISLYKQGKPIQAMYKGVHLIWQGIRSCFGSGMWINEKPWLNDEGWKNN
jgi:hypothetical protein